jgi:hypothetical protein
MCKYVDYNELEDEWMTVVDWRHLVITSEMRSLKLPILDRALPPYAQCLRFAICRLHIQHSPHAACWHCSVMSISVAAAAAAARQPSC